VSLTSQVVVWENIPRFLKSPTTGSDLERRDESRLLPVVRSTRQGQ